MKKFIILVTFLSIFLISCGKNNTEEVFSVSISSSSFPVKKEYAEELEKMKKEKMEYENNKKEELEEKIKEEENLTDLPNMIMIDGNFYIDTNEESNIDGRCGIMDGKIDSSVNQNERPLKNNQSNFGEGYEYQYINEFNIDVFFKDTNKWIRFNKVYPTRVYYLENFENSFIPRIYLCEDNQSFTLNFDPLSSYSNFGYYKIDDDILSCLTSDRLYLYTFKIIDDNTLEFQKDKSSKELPIFLNSEIDDKSRFIYIG